MSSITISAARRRVRTLRQACSDHERETARLKQEAERSTSDPIAASQLRFLVDLARGPVFQKLRDDLRAAEERLSTWTRSDRKAVAPKSFGSMIAKALASPRDPGGTAGGEG